jgi:hypothetical protein
VTGRVTVWRVPVGNFWRTRKQGGDEQPRLAARRLGSGIYPTYPLVASLCRFTYSQSRFVMADGGIGALPNSDSSVSVQPLKQTWYPPNGTFFGGLPLRFPLAFAIISTFPLSG